MCNASYIKCRYPGGWAPGGPVCLRHNIFLKSLLSGVVGCRALSNINSIRTYEIVTVLDSYRTITGKKKIAEKQIVEEKNNLVFLKNRK